MLANYRRLFAVPHVLSLLLWSLAARFYMPGLIIGVTFLVEEWTGSYAIAGLVTGSFTLGMALVGPLRGRMADRGGSDRLVLVCGAVFATGMLVLIFLPPGLWWVAIPLALGTGLFSSPANQIVRALWPRLTEEPERQAVYAAEATTQELLFVFSPIVAAGVVALAGPRPALLVLTALGLLGAVGFALALRRAGVTGPAPADPGNEEAEGGRRRSLMLYPAQCLVVMLCLMMVTGVMGVDLVLVAWANELNAPHYVMALASVWALGSLVGGAIAGALPGRPRLVLRCFATVLGVAVLVPFVPPLMDLPTPLLITPLLFVSGMTLAPTLAAVMGRLGDTAPAGRRAEAFGWMATAMGIGGAVAGPVTGALIDNFGIAGGVAGATGSFLVAAVLSLLLPRPRPGSETEPNTGPATETGQVSAPVPGAATQPSRAEPDRTTDGPAPAAPTGPAESPRRPFGR